MTKKTIAVALAALSALPLGAVTGTIRTATDAKTGDIRWQARAKSYAVSFKKGKTDVSAEYPLADVEALDIDKPAEFDKAVTAFEKGNPAAAIAPMTKIVQEYRMLVWDKPAGRYLALAYLAAGQTQKAYEACQNIIQDDKTAAWKGDLAPAYWQTLLKLGKKEQLEGLLKKAATSGDRAASAAACSMRGDVILAEGDAPEIYRRALRDGFLKVALMYNDAACATERREAMLKAAQCFDKLGQTARAEKLRTQAAQL